MLPIITGLEGDLIKIDVTINLSDSMLEAEESILQRANAVGNVATGEALKRFDVDGDPIMVGGAKWHSKCEVQKIRRFIIRVMAFFQRSIMFISLPKGARPSARWIEIRVSLGKATPRFAKIVLHKFAQGAATQVLEAEPWSPLP